MEMETKSICFGTDFGKWLSVLLTGNPDDQHINTLVRQAANREITDNVLFLRLAEKYGSGSLLTAFHNLISENERKQNELPGRSEIKDVCGVCITPGLLGKIISMKQWYSGEDNRFMEEIIEKISTDNITIEDALTELIVRFGKSFVDGFDRIDKDTDTVYNTARKKARERNPGG